jgi:hypothetical protein
MVIVDHAAGIPTAIAADDADGRGDKTALPTNIDIASARLPATYEQAKAALASCERIDECKTWANKAEALASYARMADDDSLRRLSDRIQARAVRRMGELLKQFDAQGQRTDTLREGALPKCSQAQAAEDVGISEHQRKQAVRVANVPALKFEAAIESERPATVTALAEMGKKARAVPPEDFKRATHLLGDVEDFAEFCAANDPRDIARDVLPEEIVDLLSKVHVIDAWLDRLVAAVNLPAAAVKARADRGEVKVPILKPNVAAAADRAEQAALAKRGNSHAKPDGVER